MKTFCFGSYGLGDDACIGGLLTITGDFIPLKYVNIKGEFINAYSHISTQFVYENDLEVPVEAIFKFPLNEVTVYYVEAVINDRIIVGECRPKAEAETTYDEAVNSGHTVFMLQESDHCEDVINMRIGNIPSKGTVKINVKYVGLMDAGNLYTSDGSFTHSEIRFTLPQTLNPRYTPKSRKLPDISKLLYIGQSFSPTRYLLDFEIIADMPYEISGVYSAHDQFDVDYSDSSKQTASIKLRNKFEQDHDLQLVFKFEQKLQSMAAIELGDESKDGILTKHCLTAQFLPDISKVDLMVQPKSEIVFMLDRSGSMYGANMRYAKCALLLLLKSLPLGCRFQIVGFGYTYKPLFAQAQEYCEESLNEAMEYQKNMDADMGGTELFNALSFILNESCAADNQSRQVILLTDGDVYNADEVIGLVHSCNRLVRVFAIGLGDGASTTLVRGIARAGGGTHAFAQNEKELNSAVMKILNAALQKQATNVEMVCDLVETDPQTGGQKPVELLTNPRYLPNVYNGQFITCHALFKCENLANLGGKLTLQFDIDGKQNTLTLDPRSFIMAKGSISVGSQPLHCLSGKCQIDELTRDYHALMVNRPGLPGGSETSEEENIRHIVEALAISLNIITKFTTSVGVDKSQCVNSSNKHPTVMSERRRYNCGLFGQAASKPMLFPSTTHGLGAVGGRAPIDQVDGANNCGLFGQAASKPMLFPSTTHGLGGDNDIGATPEFPLHVKLAELQEFKGCWKLNSSLSDLMGVDLQSLTEQCPNISNLKSTTELIWATALVLAYFEVKLLDVKDEWTLMSMKGMSWLCEQLTNLSSELPLNEKCGELLNKAKMLLRKLLKC